ncbi:Glycosyl transferase, family 8 [Corchorus capsularis]|uniref:Glycosyl transferase, family 8 n=1 Tax=Corchorus capsularis TaxID=210143 RepID=A0A1R3JW88_COCAP|nr:Glycosyl transferase, family 8 [Corchorus capsularis]
MVQMLTEQEQDASSAAVMLSDAEKDVDIIATYSDASGNIRASRVKMKDLSASWVLENPSNGDPDKLKGPKVLKLKDSYPASTRPEENVEHFIDDHQLQEGEAQNLLRASWSPVKFKRQRLRQRRRDLRTEELIRQDKEADKLMQATEAIESLKITDTVIKGKYSIWRKDFESPNSDSTLKLMRDQIIMAKAYANIAKSENQTNLYNSLLKHIRESLRVIGEANSDAELHPSSLDYAKAMGHALSIAKDQLYDCRTVARKLRAMLQATENNVGSLKKRSAFLIQLAAKTIPKPLHCLPLQLAADYFLHGYQNKKNDLNKEKLEDPSLYHYAIFSDNVLATSVVVNSTALHAKEPEKHVFHIVTDKLNFPAMKMWFILNAPEKATIQVENIDDFKWLNSSYCSVLRQLESSRIKEYYFKANHPSSLSVGSDHLKYRNPKYLSMLNHLRFYLPEVYPKLHKILFLDDDIVVQKDLTPLWDVDLQGMVNGAVETCKESFHRFDKYLNFTNPLIEKNFDPNACGWAYGMNIFDLKEWRKRNITGIYHHWQDLNEDRTLWKLGTLPPGLITFYNLTYPLDRKWHVLGLGYDPALNQTEIENAAVIHYNGNYKPWLDLAVAKYSKRFNSDISVMVATRHALSSKPMGFNAPKLELENQGIITYWEMGRCVFSISGDEEMRNSTIRSFSVPSHPKSMSERLPQTWNINPWNCDQTRHAAVLGLIVKD